jgi:hypothetical protein
MRKLDAVDAVALRLQGQLGLKPEPDTGLIEMLVVDSEDQFLWPTELDLSPSTLARRFRASPRVHHDDGHDA